MDRTSCTRRHLLAAGMGMAAIAGCLGDDDADDIADDTDDAPVDDADDDDAPVDDDDSIDDADDTEPADDDPPEPDYEEIAAEQLESARNALQGAFDEMETRHDDDFENDPFQASLAEAEDALDAAAEHATGAQEDELGDLRGVIAYLRPWGDAENDAQVGFEQLEPASDAYWEGRDAFWLDDPDPADFIEGAESFETAVDGFENAHKRFESAAIGFENAREELEALDADVLAEFEHADVDDHVDHFDFAQYFTANLNFFNAGHSLGASGWAHTAYGMQFILEDDVETARELFEDAEGMFEDVPGTYMFVDFQFLYDIAPFFEDMFEILLCENEHGVEMSEHFLDALDALEEGDEDAFDEHLDEAFEAPMVCH